MKKTGTRFGNFVGGGAFIITAGMFLFFLVSNAVDVVRLRLQPAIEFRVINTEIVPADSGRSGFDLIPLFMERHVVSVVTDRNRGLRDGDRNPDVRWQPSGGKGGDLPRQRRGSIRRHAGAEAFGMDVVEPAVLCVSVPRRGSFTGGMEGRESFPWKDSSLWFR